MMDSSLPLDIWRATLDFLSIPDQISLSWTSKDILSTIEQTGVFEAHAKSKFPLHLLDIAQYNHSWLKLVQHDNAKNGYYRLQLNHHPLQFGLTHGFFFRTRSVHKVRSMSWDRLRNEIILEIEAFGDYLPRTALRECLVRFDYMQTPATSFFLPDHTRCPLLQKVSPVRFDEYEHNTNQHQLFRLYFDATLILSDTTYSYRYSYNNESAASFLSREDVSSIRELFDYPKQKRRGELIARQVSIDGSENGTNMALLDLEAMQQPAAGPCEFVSRSTPALLEPSNVQDWDMIRTRLPATIRVRGHGTENGVPYRSVARR